MTLMFDWNAMKWLILTRKHLSGQLWGCVSLSIHKLTLNDEKTKQGGIRAISKNGNIDIKRTKEQKIWKIFYSLFLQKALLKQSGISTVILYRRAGEAELLLPPRGPSLSWPSSWPCLGKRLYQGMGVSIWACPDMICVGGGGDPHR